MKIKQIADKLSALLFWTVVSILVYALMQHHDPVSVVHGNFERNPLEFTLEETNDVVCKMLIRSRENSAEAVDEKGDTHFFNDPGCMVLWLREQPKAHRYQLWIYTLDTHRWIDARLAWYGVRDKTVMGYGFGAREKKHPDAIDFDTMYRRMIHSETLLNPKIRKSLLEDRYER